MCCVVRHWVKRGHDSVMSSCIVSFIFLAMHRIVVVCRPRCVVVHHVIVHPVVRHPLHLFIVVLPPHSSSLPPHVLSFHHLHLLIVMSFPHPSSCHLLFIISPLLLPASVFTCLQPPAVDFVCCSSHSKIVGVHGWFGCCWPRRYWGLELGPLPTTPKPRSTSKSANGCISLKEGRPRYMNGCL